MDKRRDDVCLFVCRGFGGRGGGRTAGKGGDRAARLLSLRTGVRESSEGAQGDGGVVGDSTFPIRPTVAVGNPSPAMRQSGGA